MSSPWDSDRARGGEDRQRVERRARQLPSGTGPSVMRTATPTVSSRARRAAKQVLHGVNRRFGALGARTRTLWPSAGQAVRALPGRRARQRHEAELRASVAASSEPRPSQQVGCVILGADDGTAGRAARRAGCNSVVTRPGSGQVPDGPEDLVCLMKATTEPLGDGWISELARAIDGPVVASAPTLLHPLRGLAGSSPVDGSILSAGIDLVVDQSGAPAARARCAGEPPHRVDCIDLVPAVTGACLLVDRDALRRAGGLPPLSDPDAAVMELCLKLRSGGGKVAVVRSTFAIDHSRRDRRRMHPAPDDGGVGWRELVERHGPTLWRQAARASSSDGRVRFAITISAPSEKMAPRWGDWHLAGALARALDRAGHAAHVQTQDHADDLTARSNDIHLVVRGLHPIRRTVGQRHVLWIVSHPETVDLAECDDADLVLVASERFARELRGRTTTPVEILLQATDQHRFRPVQPHPEHRHPLAVVAKTRDMPRPIVMDAIAAGLRPAIYGTGWEAFVDPALIMAPYVPNEDLPVVYSSVGVLLNDHWQTMRQWGFVSNRLFDALACGTPVVSDHMPEIEAVLDGAVGTYQSPDDLPERVAEMARRATESGSRARLRDVVVPSHTFDARAAALLDLLDHHGLLTPPSVVR